MDTMTSRGDEPVPRSPFLRETLLVQDSVFVRLSFRTNQFPRGLKTGLVKLSEVLSVVLYKRTHLGRFQTHPRRDMIPSV